MVHQHYHLPKSSEEDSEKNLSEIWGISAKKNWHLNPCWSVCSGNWFAHLSLGLDHQGQQTVCFGSKTVDSSLTSCKEMWQGFVMLSGSECSSQDEAKL